MKISDVLRNKGTEVVTIRPDETVSRLLEALAEHRVGALVVSPDGAAVAGIVSERDVVRHLHQRGAAVLTIPVSEIMTVSIGDIVKHRIDSLQSERDQLVEYIQQ